MTIRNLCRASLLFAVLGLVLLAPGAALAQYQYPPPYPSYGPSAYGAPLDRSGLYLGLGAFGDGVINQANSSVDFLTSGAGYNLMIGFRLSPNFALELGFGEGFHNNVTNAWGDTVDYLVLSQVTADAKLILPLPGGQIQPFVQGGVGFYVLADAYDSEIASGGGFQLGGGLDFWVNPWWSFGGRLLYHGIQFTSFNEPQVGRSSSPFLSTVSLEANAQIHF
jgi:hypothetical protein